MNILSYQSQIEGLGRVVNKITARINLGDIALHTLWIDTDHDVGASTTAQIAILTHTYFIPGGHPLNVRGEYVAGAYGDTHPKNCFGEHAIGTGGTCAIHIGKLYDEVVNGLLCLHDVPALVTLYKNRCMSQAPVGQRSAHSPQCKHTFSSFTMTRLV